MVTTLLLKQLICFAAKYLGEEREVMESSSSNTSGTNQIVELIQPCIIKCHNNEIVHSHIVCVQILAAPFPTTFSAATVKLLYFDGTLPFTRWEVGIMWRLHLPSMHSETVTVSVMVTFSARKWNWYCVMFPLTPGHGSLGFWWERW